MKARTLAILVLALVAVLAGMQSRRRAAPPEVQALPRRPARGLPRRPARGLLRKSLRATAGITVVLAVAFTAFVSWQIAAARPSSAILPSDDTRASVALVASAPGSNAAPGPETIDPPTSLAGANDGAEPQEWRLLAGGDVLLDQSEATGFDPFAGLVPALGSGDLVAVNLEMVIARSGTPEPKSFVFRVPPSAAQTLAAAGIDVGNLGNNHALDYGPDALLESIGHLRRAGVSPVGGGANVEEAYAPASFSVGGVAVAVIGASRVFPRAYWAADEGPGLASAYAEGRLLDAVRAARRSHDVVIVMVHWGFERQACPTRDQVRLGAALLEAGASVVLGSHPHVLQPIVQQPRGLIAFSLGNFVWAPRQSPEGDTGVLEVRFRGAELTGYSFHPHVLNEQGAPVPAGPHRAAGIAAAVGTMCVSGGVAASTG
ncbi:MAG: CapA family protein [Chloroflexi bacterium]|nr:CapA family protein [Chloroflexota bacterium]